MPPTPQWLRERVAAWPPGHAAGPRHRERAVGSTERRRRPVLEKIFRGSDLSRSSAGGGRQIGGRDQDAELDTPDDHARIVLQVDTLGDGVFLASLESAQLAEIDVHGALDVRGLADFFARHEIDMECRPRPDLEVLFEEDKILVHRNVPLPVVDWVRGVCVNEHPAGENVGLLLGRESLHRRRWRKHIGKDEEADGDTEGRSKNAADKECQDPAPHRHLLQWSWLKSRPLQPQYWARK